MGGKRFKKSSIKRNLAKVEVSQGESALGVGPTAEEVADLAVDLWKLGERVRTESASDRVETAYERSEDRLKRIGFDVDTMTGRLYDTNMKAKVGDHEAGEGPLMIGQCISPAVFYKGRLVREAEIVTIGGEEKK